MTKFRNQNKYLESLKMILIFDFIDDTNIERATQLFNKTNQFNVSCSNIVNSRDVLNIMKKKLKSSSKIVESRKKNFSYTISSKKLGKIYKTMTVQKTINTFLEDMNSIQK